jgi:hypothetical protein
MGIMTENKPDSSPTWTLKKRISMVLVYAMIAGIFVAPVVVIYLGYVGLKKVGAALVAPPPGYVEIIPRSERPISEETLRAQRAIVQSTTEADYSGLAELCENAVMVDNEDSFRFDFAEDRTEYERKQIPAIVASLKNDPNAYVRLDVPANIYRESFSGVDLWIEVHSCKVYSDGSIVTRREDALKFD